ncbi:MAG: isoprenylcysteine carboxylmethyltransferase family protein, partial [Pseudomonadota bacterium]
YKIVRHPLYVGWFIVMWATPTMSMAHLFFALATSAYMLMAIPLEEKDLADAHPEYADYKRRVPMLIPGLRRAARRAVAGGAS